MNNADLARSGIDDSAAIRKVIEDWVLFRDAARWKDFETVWHSDGWMTATWFQGPYLDFIRESRAGFEQGIRILHFLGGFTCEINSHRAISQTKMKIQQRATVDGVDVDVTCTGRFFDFLEKRDGRWALVRRQPIYEQDRLDPVFPDSSLTIDRARLSTFPIGYQFLGYVQESVHLSVRKDLPGITGPATDNLYAEGNDWLAGSPRADDVNSFVS